MQKFYGDIRKIKTFAKIAIITAKEKDRSYSQITLKKMQKKKKQINTSPLKQEDKTEKFFHILVC